MPNIEIEIDFTDPQKIPPLLALIVKRLLEGKLDAKVGHAACYAIHIAQRAYELGEAKAKMDRIERLLQQERDRLPGRAEISDRLHFEPREVDEIYDDLFPEPKKEAKINESPAGAGEEFPG